MFGLLVVATWLIAPYLGIDLLTTFWITVGMGAAALVGGRA